MRRLRLSSPDGPVRAQTVRGDAAAFARVYERHHQALYRYCRSILHDEEEARDALQSTMAKAFAALSNEQRDFELRPWLYRIAHNEAISRLRERRVRVVELEAAHALGSDTLAQAVEARERLAQLRADLRLLTERQRSALLLRELCGLGHDEIAVVLDSSPRAVKQTIFEARQALLECEAGRGLACTDVQRALSDGDGRVLRARRMRAHVRSCQLCGTLASSLQRRPADLAQLAPPLPAAASGALLDALLRTTAGVGVASVGGGVAASLGGSLVMKAAVAMIAAAGIGGAVTVAREGGAPPPQRPGTPPAAAASAAPAARSARPAAPVRTQRRTAPQRRAAIRRATPTAAAVTHSASAPPAPHRRQTPPRAAGTARRPVVTPRSAVAASARRPSRGLQHPSIAARPVTRGPVRKADRTPAARRPDAEDPAPSDSRGKAAAGEHARG